MVGYVVMAVIGFVSLLAGARLLRRIRCVRRWPTAAGRFLEKKIGPKRAAVPTERGYNWEAQVRYVYQVDGREFAGQRIYPYDQYGRRERAEALLASLPDPPTVRYDPANPENSYLSAGSTFWAWFGVLAGTFFFLIGLGLALSPAA